MRHPKSRGERRAVRDAYIAHRKYIHQAIWRMKTAPRYSVGPGEAPPSMESFSEWGRYAKFNLNCGCMMCHSQKYFSAKRQRRRALDEAVIEGLKRTGMSDDQHACGLVAPKNEVKLSDEQVDLLNQDPGVIAARQAFFADKTDEKHKQYLEVFYARLAWVIQNPPTPKEKPKRIVGFATRA